MDQTMPAEYWDFCRRRRDVLNPPFFGLLDANQFFFTTSQVSDMDTYRSTTLSPHADVFTGQLQCNSRERVNHHGY